jgi:hypothetical protein
MLENEKLQVQSESCIQNQESIMESLIIGAGAGAEAAAIIQETSSKSASPNLGLESLITNEKMNRFLGTPEPEECSQEDYFNPMVFHPSAFESGRPKQALTFTHPVVTTTTTPANNVYVPPPKLSFRAEPPVAANFPEVSQAFTHVSMIQRPLLLLPTTLMCTCLSWVSESALRRLSCAQHPEPHRHRFSPQVVLAREHYRLIQVRRFTDQRQCP